MSRELDPVQFFWGANLPAGEVIPDLLKIKPQPEPPLEKLVYKSQSDQDKT
jgi:hypothetical protein